MKFPLREALLALGLVAAGTAVTYGVSQLHEAAGWIVGGILLACLTLLFLAEAGD